MKSPVSRFARCLWRRKRKTKQEWPTKASRYVALQRNCEGYRLCKFGWQYVLVYSKKNRAHMSLSSHCVYFFVRLRSEGGGNKKALQINEMSNSRPRDNLHSLYTTLTNHIHTYKTLRNIYPHSFFPVKASCEIKRFKKKKILSSLLSQFHRTNSRHVNLYINNEQPFQHGSIAYTLSIYLSLFCTFNDTHKDSSLVLHIYIYKFIYMCILPGHYKYIYIHYLSCIAILWRQKRSKKQTEKIGRVGTTLLTSCVSPSKYVCSIFFFLCEKNALLYVSF